MKTTEQRYRFRIAVACLGLVAFAIASLHMPPARDMLPLFFVFLLSGLIATYFIPQVRLPNGIGVSPSMAMLVMSGALLGPGAAAWAALVIAAIRHDGEPLHQTLYRGANYTLSAVVAGYVAVLLSHLGGGTWFFLLRITAATITYDLVNSTVACLRQQVDNGTPWYTSWVDIHFRMSNIWLVWGFTPIVGGMAVYNTGVAGALPALALVVGVFRMFRLYADLHQQRNLAVTDRLTQVYNRSFLDEWLRTEGPKQGKTPTSVLFVDMVGLKETNDRYGHQSGDESIQVAAQTLKRCVRRQDVIIRYGGDEFLVICPGAHAGTCRALAEACDSAFGALPLLPSGAPVRVTIGQATYPGDAPDLEALIASADRDMYRVRAEQDHGRVRRASNP